MKRSSRVPTVARLLVTTAFACVAVSGFARPYATSLTNSGTSISFRLNESADNVKIISAGGAVTNDLGALPKGLHIENLTITGDFKVQVTKSSGPGYLQGIVNQISEDTNNFVKFANQRGVSVNKNTNSPYFGRIYVSVSAAGTADGRSVSDGIYILNADQTDAVGQGDAPRTGGIVFDSAGASAESPNRVVVGPDDNLYITDWSDAQGGLYVADPDVTTTITALAGLGGPYPVIHNHGSMSAVWVEGSLATGNLTIYTQDEDLDPRNGVFRYDVGAGPLPFADPGTFLFSFGLGAQYSDIVRGPDGKWYGSNRRAEFATTTGVFALSEDGTTVLWTSLGAWRESLGDPAFPRDSYFGETRGIDISPDGKYLAAIRGATNNPVAPIIPPFVGANTVLILPLENGVPNITNLIVMPTSPGISIGRDISFDAAGNIYVVSSGQGLLRIYSPGGFSVATTGSDGTFDLFVPSVDVSVTATDNTASEGGGDNAQYTISRASTDISQPLTVRFNMTGTALNGVDYVLQTNSVTLTTNAVVIPAGVTEVVVTLVPTDDSEAELTETAIMGIAPSADYTVAGAGALVTISDNETPVLQIAAQNSTMYERLAFDYASFRISRLGDLSAFLSIEEANITTAGTATLNVDYYLTNLPVTLNPGDVSVDVVLIAPADDSVVEGPETVVLGLSNGTGFTAATNTGTVTITDDDLGPETVLFSEDFNNPDTAANWAFYFDSVAPEQNDRNAVFGFDYSGLLIPPAPHSTGGDTLGLYLQVNQNGSGAAAINFYPTNVSFSGNFALRFDMFAIQSSAAMSTTEYAAFGINHDGTHTNWFRNSAGGVPGGGSYDGLWYGVELDAAALGDYVLYSSPTTAGNNPTALTPGRNASTLTDVFKKPPFSFAGAVANEPFGSTPSWADVEISQLDNIVTLKINNTVIFSYTNTTSYTAGTIMLGFIDAYDSLAPFDAGVIYDNVRVVQLASPGQPDVTGIQIVGGNVVIGFTNPSDAPASAFTLERSSNVVGPYVEDTAANITRLSAGVYEATTPYTDGNVFFRIAQ